MGWQDAMRGAASFYCRVTDTDVSLALPGVTLTLHFALYTDTHHTQNNIDTRLAKIHVSGRADESGTFLDGLVAHTV